MKKLLLTLSTLLLCACASKPPAPDWQANTFASLNAFTRAYLDGNNTVAEFEWARARTELSRTGRTDLMARLELNRCAAQVASLDLQACTAYETLAVDAQAPEQAYAALISGRWSGLDPALLPVAYRSLVTQALENAKRPNSAQQPQPLLNQIPDPLSRLIAAGALLQRQQLAPADVELAVNTASSHGWRRPLLAWLGVQLKLTQTAGDTSAAQYILRRIEQVQQAR